MACQRCGSERVASLSAKHADLFSLKCDADDVDVENDYAPEIKEVCDGDYTNFSFCLDCGQIQGSFPKTVG